MIPTIRDLLIAAASLCYTAYTVVDYSTKSIKYFSILAIYEAPAVPLDSFPTDLIFDLHFPCPPMVTLIASAKEDHNKDRALPVEILTKIVLMSHNISPLSPSFMRVSRNCHAIAQPLVYETIRLNRHTLPKLIFDFVQSDKGHYTKGKVAMNAVKARIESRYRKLYSFEHTTTLIIDDIPVLFRPEFDFYLHEFCKWIILPNVTKIIFCQEPKGPWTEDQLLKSTNHNEPLEGIKRRLSNTRAMLFRKVLPAKTKDVCVQIPPVGGFKQMGNINRYNNKLPAHLVNRALVGNSWHEVSTTDLVMQYIEKLSGTVNLRIHQNMLETRHLNHATIPATYVYRPLTPDPRAIEQSLGPIRVARSSGLAALHHLAQFWPSGYSKRARQDIYDIYYRLIHSIDKPLDNHLPLVGQIALLRQMGVSNDRTQDEAEKAFLMKVYQGVSALHPDSTTPCPCCKEIGIPL